MLSTLSSLLGLFNAQQSHEPNLMQRPGTIEGVRMFAVWITSYFRTVSIHVVGGISFHSVKVQIYKDHNDYRNHHLNTGARLFIQQQVFFD